MSSSCWLLVSLLAATSCLAAAAPQEASGTWVPFCIPILSLGGCRATAKASTDVSSVQLWQEAAPAQATATAATPSISPLVKALGGAAEAAALSSRCKAGTWNSTNNSCTCAPGWTGQACITCTGDQPQVCPVVTGDASSTCSTAVEFSPNTQYKAYSCSMSEGFASLVSGITGVCSVTGGTPPGWVNGALGWAPTLGRPTQASWCQLQVELVESPSIPLQCSLSDCSFPVASNSFVCSRANCSCPGPMGCTGVLHSVVPAIGAMPLSFGCSASGECRLKGVMQLELLAQCRAGECTQPRKVAAAGLLSGAGGAPTRVPPGPVQTGQEGSSSTGSGIGIGSGSGQPLEPHAALAAVVGAAPLALLLVLAVGGAGYLYSKREWLRPCSNQAATGGAHHVAIQDVSGTAKQSMLVPTQQQLHPQLSQHTFKPSPSAGGCTGRLLPCEEEGLPVELVFQDVTCLLPGAGTGRAGGAPSGGVQPGDAPSWWNKLWNMSRTRRPALGDQGNQGMNQAGNSSSDGSSGLSSSVRVEQGPGSAAGNAVTLPPAAALPAEGAGSNFRTGGYHPGTAILHGISGRAAAGQVLGVMGPSGSGKSTLLCILSGSRGLLGAGSSVTGRVTLGGEARGSALRKVTAFVPQKDVLLPSLTVEECVRYSALLRLPLDTPAVAVQERISRVLQELHLTHVAPSLVGGIPAIRGVSGGERRRVTIAMELVTLPRCLLMDEPTSGLDSFTAYQLMQAARELAAAGRVVVMSLHQPSPDMFQQLDRVLLLAKGQLAYCGPPGQVNRYLTAAGLGDSLSNMAPAEKLLHVASQQDSLDRLLNIQQAAMGGVSESGCGATTTATAATSSSSSVAVVQQPSNPQQPLTSPCCWPAAASEGTLPHADLEGGQNSTHSSSSSSSSNTSAMWQATAMAICGTADAGQDMVSHAGSRQGVQPLSATTSSSSASTGGAHLCAVVEPVEPLQQEVCSKVMPEALACRQDRTKQQQQQQPLQRSITHQSTISRSDSSAPQWPARVWAACRRAGHTFSLLLWRCFKDLWRSPGMLLLHSGVALVMGLMVGLVFFRLDTTNVGVQNRLGAIFFALALLGFCSISIIDSLVLERELVTREVHARYYGSAPYLAAKLVLDGLLLRGLPAVLFTALMYPLVGLAGEFYKAATFVLVLATYAATVGVLAVALTAVCRSAAGTSLTLNLLLLLWVLIGGYLVNPASIPVWLRWVRWLCPMSYAFEALASNELTGQVYNLRVNGLPNIDGISGDVFLATLGLVPGHALQNVAVLVAFYVGSVLLAAAAVRASLQQHGGRMLQARSLMRLVGRT